MRICPRNFTADDLQSFSHTALFVFVNALHSSILHVSPLLSSFAHVLPLLASPASAALLWPRPQLALPHIPRFHNLQFCQGKIHLGSLQTRGPVTVSYHASILVAISSPVTSFTAICHELGPSIKRLTLPAATSSASCSMRPGPGALMPSCMLIITLSRAIVTFSNS